MKPSKEQLQNVVDICKSYVNAAMAVGSSDKDIKSLLSRVLKEHRKWEPPHMTAEERDRFYARLAQARHTVS